MRSSIRRILPLLALFMFLGGVAQGCSSPMAPPPTEDPEDDPPDGPNDGVRGLALLIVDVLPA